MENQSSLLNETGIDNCGPSRKLNAPLRSDSLVSAEAGGPIGRGRACFNFITSLHRTKYHQMANPQAP